MPAAIAKRVDMPSGPPVIYSASDAVEAATKTDQLQKVLKAVKQFESQYQKFIDLELGILNQLDKLPFEVADSGRKYVLSENSHSTEVVRYLNWWLNLTDVARKDAVAEATRSWNSIRGVYRLRKRGGGTKQSAIDAAWAECDNVVDEYSRDGRTSINLASGFNPQEGNTISTGKTINAIKNRAKDRLLGLGAVGIGNGVYVNPATRPDEAMRSLDIKAKSIWADLLSLRQTYMAIGAGRTVDRGRLNQLTQKVLDIAIGVDG